MLFHQLRLLLSSFVVFYMHVLNTGTQIKNENVVIPIERDGLQIAKQLISSKKNQYFPIAKILSRKTHKKIAHSQN